MISLINKKEMKGHPRVNYSLLVLFLTVICVVSCVRHAVYNEFVLIHPDGWSADSVGAFSLDIKDTVSLYDMWINVRHTGGYPYQNLWLFVEEISPDSLIRRDTIPCLLADYTGKWIGSGSGSVYLLSVPFKQQFRFDQTGIYQYTIFHGMRDEVLMGIHAIGLKLENKHGKK